MSCASPRGKSNRTTVQRWHGTIRRTRPERRAADLGGRAGGQNRLVQVVEHRQPLGRAAEPLLGALPLGDVGDHADRADDGAVPARDRAGGDESPHLGAVLLAEPVVVALHPRLRAAQRPLRGRPDSRVEEVVHRPAEHGAVLVAEQLRHPLVDVGDDAVVVRDPDAFLRRVDQLLEALLALLQRLGPLLQPPLARLECRRVLQRRADQAAEQPERLRVAVAERLWRRREHLERADDAVVVAERDHQDRADALAVIGVVPDPRVRQDVVRPLQLAGPDRDARQAAAQR